MENLEQVSMELLNQIREHINRIEKMNQLLECRKKWLQLTSSLNVLEDSACVVSYYCTENFPSSLGGKYLFIYGLLQALFIQQDTINSISIALFDKRIDIKADYPDAYAVRECRNDVVGHPTNRSDGKAFIYLVQVSLYKDCFSYLKQSPDEIISGDNIHVNVSKAINDTARCVNDILSKAVDRLDEEFRAYINAHKERKMRKIFDTLNYAREKVLSNDILKPAGYNSTKRMVKECEEELVRRYGSVKVMDSFAYTLEKIHAAYDLIDNALCDVQSETRGKFEQCLLEYLFDRLEKLVDLSCEVDEYFEEA